MYFIIRLIICDQTRGYMKENVHDVSFITLTHFIYIGQNMQNKFQKQ